MSHISKNGGIPTKCSSAAHVFRVRMISRHMVQTAQNIPLGDTLTMPDRYDKECELGWNQKREWQFNKINMSNLG